MKATLRRWFGPSREEIFRQLADQVGGEFVDGGVWKSDKVHATHGQWVVTLDTYAVQAGKVTIVYTRMRAPYVNPDGFRFVIYRKSIFSGLGRLLGMQDIEIGDPSFDHDFIVKATSEDRVRQLLSNARIRELIASQKGIRFEVKDDEGWFGTRFPEGVDELAFSVEGVIKDVDRLKRLYDLFAETLDELCRMGSAYERAPEVTL